MKKFLVGNYCTDGGGHFNPPYYLIEAGSARESIRKYNRLLNQSSGEVMCIIDQRTGSPAHHHKDTDTTECLSALSDLSSVIKHDVVDYDSRADELENNK